MAEFWKFLCLDLAGMPVGLWYIMAFSGFSLVVINHEKKYKSDSSDQSSTPSDK